MFLSRIFKFIVGNKPTDIREAITGKEADPQTVVEAIKEGNNSQVSVNLAEAMNSNLFVAGWRPAIGWVAVLGIFFYYIPQFILASYLWVKMTLDAGVIVEYPMTTAGNDMFELVIGLLGLVGIRTFEKIKGVTK